MPFFSHKSSNAKDQLRTLREEVLMALDDPAKTAFLAKVLNCKNHEVRAHPRLVEILDKIEALFLSWLDPQTSLADVDSIARQVAALHDRAGVPISWMFEVMRKVQGKARALKAPDCFFERSDDFLQKLIQAHETFWTAQQEHFQEEQHYWQEIFNTLTEGICVFDLDGAIYDMNDAYCQLSGYTREELLQKGWLALTAPEYRDEDQKRLPDILAGIVVRFEKAYIHKDGHTVPIFVSYRRLKRRSGWDKDRLVATCVDLSALKTQEKILQEERAYWQQIFNTAPTGMMIMDEKGHALEINETFAKTHGYTLEELKTLQTQGMDPGLMFVPTEQQSLATEALQRAMRSDERVAIELNNQTRDGRFFFTLDLLQRIQTANRQAILLAQIDLTELKQREKEIQQLLDDAQTYLQRLAAAKLIHDERDTAGAARLLQETYNQCVNNLQFLIGTVATAAQALMASSEELSQSQADLSDRSNKEAASLEEISANVEEISSAVSENAKHAERTQNLAEDVLTQLTKARQSMRTVNAIIVDSVKGAAQTTAIAKAIQDIAFTTNILSLNASVEAARAGAEGKGFAVIAGEIRRLAQRVSQESQRAESIIQALVTSMQSGEKGMLDVTLAIDSIEHQAQTMTENVQAIAAASKEQDQGLQELAKGINILEEGLTHNAAMVEEIHATSESLTSQTQMLLSAIGRFQMDEDQEVDGMPPGSFIVEQDIAHAARLAIAAHQHFRQHLQDTMQHGRAPDPEVVGDFHRCAFGQVLDNNKALQSHPDYRRIRQLYQAFHQEGRKIAKLLQQGLVQEVRQQLLGESHYNEVTRALIDALEHLSANELTSAKRLGQIKISPKRTGSQTNQASFSSVAKHDGWDVF